MSSIARLLALLAGIRRSPSPEPPPRPTILFTGAAGPITASPYPLTLTLSDSGNVARVDFFKGTVQIGQSLSAPYTCAAKLTFVDNGEVQFRAVVVDKQGEAREVSFKMDVAIGAPDTTAPIPLLTASSLNFTANGTLTLNASATDAGGAVTLLLTRDGTPITIPLDGVVTEGITRSSNGQHTYLLRATDAAGNFAETSKIVNVAIPLPAPTLTLDRAETVTEATVTATLGNLQPGDTLDWGDGVVVTGAASLSHSYGRGGVYTITVQRSGAAATSAGVTIRAPIQPVGLSNDGDAFIWTYAGYTGAGTVDGYRTYSLRSAGGISRVLIAETTTATPVRDDTVQDGAVAWYKTYMVVGGQEMLVDSAMDTQPMRAGWIADQLVISAPGTYTLRHRNLDRTRAAVVVNAGVTGVVFMGLLASKGDGIAIGENAEVTVQDLRGWGLHPGVANSAHGKMVSGSRAAKVTVEHCYGENWLFSVYVDGQQDGMPTTSLKNFRIRYNRFRNCEGRRTTATDYVQTGDSRASPVAHFIQLNGCAGILNAEIAWNDMTQEPDAGYVEDPVNIYNSSCVTGNWGRIHHNLCYGGNAPNEIATRSYAGVGIIFDGVSSRVQFWKAYSNTVTTSNGGVGVAHGYDIDVYDNDAYNAGVLEDGRKIWGVNVGIYAYDYVPSDPIKRIRVYGNRSRYYRTPGTSQDPNSVRSGEYGSFYLTKNGVDGNEMDYAANTELPLEPDPDARLATERALYRAWGASAVAAGVTVGTA